MELLSEQDYIKLSWLFSWAVKDLLSKQFFVELIGFDAGEGKRTQVKQITRTYSQSLLHRQRKNIQRMPKEWQTRPLYGWTGCCIIGQTPLMQWLEVIIARLDHHGEYRWSNWPRYLSTWFGPPSTPDFSGNVGLNLALGLVTYCCSCPNCMMETCMLMAGVRTHEHWWPQ